MKSEPLKRVLFIYVYWKDKKFLIFSMHNFQSILLSVIEIVPVYNIKGNEDPSGSSRLV